MFGVLVMMYVSEIYSIGSARNSRNGGGAIVKSRYRTAGKSESNRRVVAAARYGMAALFFLVLFTGFMIMATGAAERTPAPAQGAESVVIVSSGETLWDIAVKSKAKDMDTRRAVYEIKKRNGLNESTLQAGQKLVIPAWQ